VTVITRGSTENSGLENTTGAGNQRAQCPLVSTDIRAIVDHSFLFSDLTFHENGVCWSGVNVAGILGDAGADPEG